MTMYNLDQFRQAVTDWKRNRALIFDSEERDDWEASDNAAVKIVNALADLMGIDDDVWTITLAGNERHDGEAPWTYVVQADDAETAKEFAIAWHRAVEDCQDALLVDYEAGMPQDPRGWSDLRGKSLADAPAT